MAHITKFGNTYVSCSLQKSDEYTIKMPRKEVMIPKQNQVYTPGVSMVDSLKQGFGFGVGSSIARSLFSIPSMVAPKDCSVFVDQLAQCKEQGFCSEDFILSIKENLKRCNHA
jgi:hypothetical protein